jgi:uncharacterized protein (UPF0548 family)
MFFLTRPSAGTIERFLDASRDLPISYGEAGITRSGPGPFDEADAVIGHGRADFDRARTALAEWSQFDLGWVQLFPRRAPIAVGTIVAVQIRHLGFWSLNGCRVVYHSTHDSDSFGYAYGTLPNHAESGEEIFEVRFDPRTEDVSYRIRATSRAQALLAHLGQPIVRALQAQFRRDSIAAMKRAITR